MSKSSVMKSFLKGLKSAATEGAEGLRIAGAPGKAAYTIGAEVGRQAGGAAIGAGITGGSLLAGKAALNVMSKLRRVPKVSLGRKILNVISDHRSPLIIGGMVGGSVFGAKAMEKKAAKSPDWRHIKKVLKAGIEEVSKRESAGQSIGKKTLNFLKEYRHPIVTGGVGGTAAMLPYMMTRKNRRRPQYVLFNVSRPSAVSTPPSPQE